MTEGEPLLTDLYELTMCAAYVAARIPPHLRALEVRPRYPVRVAASIERLAAELDARTS